MFTRDNGKTTNFFETMLPSRVKEMLYTTLCENV